MFIHTCMLPKYIIRNIIHAYIYMYACIYDYVFNYIILSITVLHYYA